MAAAGAATTVDLRPQRLAPNRSTTHVKSQVHRISTVPAIDLEFSMVGIEAARVQVRGRFGEERARVRVEREKENRERVKRRGKGGATCKKEGKNMSN